MTVWEIIFNISASGATIAMLLFVRHLVKMSGRDRLHDSELVEQFRETAPYHLLEDLIGSKNERSH